MQKSVQDHASVNTLTGLVAGLFGGCIKYLSTLSLTTTFVRQLFEAGMTALVCGMCGVIGKNILVFASKKIKKIWSKNFFRK